MAVIERFDPDRQFACRAGRNASCSRRSALVHREWRPQLLGIIGIPAAVSQYQGVDAYTFFRAPGYRDFYDHNDIACGIRIYTPSGKTLDVRGFFEGMMNAPKDVQVGERRRSGAAVLGSRSTSSTKRRARKKKKRGGKQAGEKRFR